MATERDKYLTRWQALTNERSSWVEHWRELSDYFQPRAGRFFVTDVNNGSKRHNNIYDSTGTRALRVLAAGMMAGMSSPARPWFRLAIPDSDLMEYDPVRLWLNEVTKRMRDVFARSNAYRSMHTMYEELGLFGTGASIIVDDYDTLIRHHPLTVGEYALAMNHRRQVDTLYREFNMTVGQIVSEFGYANCSNTVKNMWDRGDAMDRWVTIVHAIEPRKNRNPNKIDQKNMAWSSCYFEKGGDADKLLAERGFEKFPALTPRWTVTGGDIYGASPGMEALGDAKQLQHEQLRKAIGIDYQSDPARIFPTALMGQEGNALPGGIMFADLAPGTGKITNASDVQLRLDFLLNDINDVRLRINQAYYADLFLMLANDDRSNITAREIAERHEEKLLMLGPVLERLHNEMHDPQIDLTFTRMLRAGMLPPPPTELEGVDLQVEFVSTLAQAQRAVGVQSIDRLIGTITALAPLKPEVVDKLDADQLVDAYSDMLGVDPSLIIADDKVAVVRKQRADQQRVQQAAALAQPAADAAQKLSTINPQQPSMLNDVLGNLQGYSTQ